MRFQVVQDFPEELDRLWARFGRPDYVTRKYRALGSVDVRVARFAAGARTIDVELERTVPAGRVSVPRWARGFVPGAQAIRHRSAWRRVGASRIDARLEIAPVGFPVKAIGTGTIVEVAPGRSRMTLDWQVDADVPIFRERAERLFAGQVRDALEADHRFTLGLLEAER